jgi:hypothetical protein
MSDIALVAMRLKDMWKMHPDQDNSRVCSRCGETVGVYPTGQRALEANPGAKIICAVCANPQPGDKSQPAGSWDEIKREMRDSMRRQ